ncbi:MAG: hypothetical protein AAGA72_12385, partial [Pseudomonadota bacterium]
REIKPAVSSLSSTKRIFMDATLTFPICHKAQAGACSEINICMVAMTTADRVPTANQFPK